MNYLTNSPLPSSQEMAAFDKLTIKAGTAAVDLMERAGQAVFELLRGRFPINSDTSICILCGPGNNGGDGIVVARHLLEDGYKPLVFLTYADRYSGELSEQLRRFRDAGGSLSEVKEHNCSLFSSVSSANIVVDALLGTGSRGEPRGVIKSLIEAGNSARANNGKIISIDIPSGIDPDTGMVEGEAMRADLTVAIEAIKRGMLQSPAKGYCGIIEVVKIGIVMEATEFFMLTKECITLPKARKTDAHKGNFGTVFVVGGSQEMPGAPILAALAAARVGAGYSRMALLQSLGYKVEFPEIMLETVEQGKSYFTKLDAFKVLPSIRESNCTVLGPGIGVAKESMAFVMEILTALRSEKAGLVLDADGLNALAVQAGEDNKYPGLVMTPHPGEAARLLGISTEAVQADRYAAARELGNRYGAIIVLKGAASVVYYNGTGFVNTTGNPWMATAGSGDVLSGVIAGLIAQGLPPFEAAKSGVLLHGLAGDMASNNGSQPIIATDIVKRISEAYTVCRN